MPALLGVNVGYPEQSHPPSIAAASARWVRTVGRDSLDYTGWFYELGARGVEVAFVLDSSDNSLGWDEGQWRARLQWFKDAWGWYVKIWQLGNEADWHGIASWTMSKEQVNRLIRLGREIFPREEGYTLLSPALVSGQPGWVEGIELWYLDGLGIHPYNKFVNDEANVRELEYMLAAYRDWWGLPLWLTEYDSRTENLSLYFRDFPGVERAAVFCWGNDQTAGEGIYGLGIRDNPWSMEYFKSAAAPGDDILKFVAGFKELHDRHPDLVGEPVENESGPWERCSLQETTNGLLVWGDFAHGMGDQKGFRHRDGRRFVWDGSQLRRRV